MWKTMFRFKIQYYKATCRRVHDTSAMCSNAVCNMTDVDCVQELVVARLLDKDLVVQVVEIL